MNEDKRIKAYLLLYKFLKENGILQNYLSNLKHTHYEEFKEGNSKTMLLKVVDNYSVYFTSYFALFHFAPTSFFWSASIEGHEFWIPYMAKWRTFYENNKTKYNL